MRGNLSLSTRIGLITGCLALVIIGMVAVNYRTNLQREGDGVVINLSGRQRMLVQKYAKELVTEIVTLPGADVVSDSRKRSIKVFEQTMSALENGGSAHKTVWDDEYVSVPAVGDVIARESLSTMRESWTQLGKHASEVRIMRPGSAGFTEKLDFALAQTISTVKAADALTERLQAISDKRTADSTRLQFIMLAFSMLIVAGALWYTRRAIVIPMTRNIDELIMAADGVAQASKQIASAGVSLSEGAQSQAAAFEETNASLESMASTIHNNTENARHASALMTETSQLVDSGAKSAGDMDGAMSKIKEATDRTSKIIKTIDEIAFQTNLLALNAAVEAARAGEAGKGFAVVAEEVRSLAIRSAEAAHNTSDLIEGTLTSVTSGVEVISRLRTVLTETTETSRKASALVQEISSSIEEQSNGIGQVSVAMQQINQITQQNAAHSEESAAASEELAGQAESSRENVMAMQMLITGKHE